LFAALGLRRRKAIGDRAALMQPAPSQVSEPMSRRTVALSGEDWWLGQAPLGSDPDQVTWHEVTLVEEWLPATVPGSVRADLVRAGRIPELTHGFQAEASMWVDHHCWWLTRDFEFQIVPETRVHLILSGVDYISDLLLNGVHLGRHEGMFSPQIRDVTDLLRQSNQLAVRIVGSAWLPQSRSTRWERFLSHIEARMGGLPGLYPHRRDTLKFQMGFGWDFAPAIRTMGIWDEVYLVASGDAFVRDVVVRQRLLEEKATLTVGVEVDAKQARPVELRCTIRGHTFECPEVSARRPIELAQGSSWHEIPLTIRRPRLWWPWDHGQPDLYELAVEVWDGKESLDSTTQTVGLRRVELDGWTLRINGRRVYARGANWVPADILPGCVTESDYRALVGLARDANMNMLRVWGGGLREKRAFYELCDQMGILVWQEFPIACAFVARYPRSPDYLRFADTEVRAIVRELRNHPSVVLWCGGNEFKPERNAPLLDTIRKAATEEDPSRPFLPASPHDGDHHSWKVWHSFHPPAAYKDDAASFASEFGLQAPPDVKALRRFIAPEDLWPPGPSWTYHGAGLSKLRRYARPFLADQDESLEAMVEASQRAQAYGLQIAIEHFRRRKARGCGGVLVWQFNEPWPAISWALVDFFRQPKPSYHAVKALFSPVLVSMEYPLACYSSGDGFYGDVWIINDGPASLSGCQVEVSLWCGDTLSAEPFQLPVDIPAGSAEVAGRVQWTLPPGGGWRLSCSVEHEGRIVTWNEYDLGAHDGIQPTARQRFRSWLGGLANPV
jgi:beta-mannosidase